MDKIQHKRAWLVTLKARNLYCALCGTLIESHNDLNADHYFVPKSKGGASDETNLQPVHKWCNSARADRTLKDWNQHGAEYLAQLAQTWRAHHVKFNKIKVAKSIKALLK